jgi:acetyl-CoA carboxylase biotin carboxyl carrier protein
MSNLRDAFDPELIRELAKLLEQTDLTEIEIEKEGVRVRVGRGALQSSTPATTAGPTAASSSSVAASAAGKPESHPGLVTSPMVGTAYLAPQPGARPFVEIGSEVKAGDTLLIIEAMKTMNQIPAPRAGKVIQILIDDGRPVEFGEPLMIIE